MDELREGGAGMSLEQAQAKITAALTAEAQARTSMIGGIVGTAVGIVAAIAFVAASIASGGTLLVATAAIVAGAGVAGAELGERMGSAAEVVQTASSLLVASIFNASTALGQLSMANKQMELEQLEGVALLQRQSQAFKAFNATSEEAIAAFKAFSEFDSTVSGDLREDIDTSEVFEDIREQGVESMKAMAQAFFQEAQALRKGINSAVEEMKQGGASITEILDAPQIQAGFEDLAEAVTKALTIQMLMTGQMKQEAKIRLGLNGMLEEEMTREERKKVLQLEGQLIQEEANKTAAKAEEAEKKRLKEEARAEKEAQAALAARLRADKAIAAAALRAAQALDLFAVEMINFGGVIDGVMVEFAALTGSIKQYKDQNEKLIASLTSGTVTPEAETAAMATAGEFGIEAEVAGLIDRIKDTERIRKILTEKGIEEFAENLNDHSS